MQWVRYEVKGSTYDTFCIEVDRLFWAVRGKKCRILDGRWQPGTSPFTPDPLAPIESGEGLKPVQVQWALEVAKANEWKPLLGGRALLATEVSAFLDSRGKHLIQEGWRTLRILVLTGAARLFPGVKVQGSALRRRCFRCGAGFGGIRRTRCARCRDVCYYCDRCLVMGRSQACIPLFLFEPLASHLQHSVCAQLSFTLSGAQRMASRRCASWWEDGESDTLLLSAVTGAGKTEVLFETLARALSRRPPVLWAAPRRDVVVEVAQRLSRAFPSVTTVTLHGESGQTWREGELYVGTVHQTMRFYRRFSLVVVDEADAFPLQTNHHLQASLDRARHPDGKRILVTATPSTSWKREFKRNHWPVVTLRTRHHGRPLPEPRIIRAWGWHRRMTARRATAPLEAFVEQVFRTDGQALMFVPRMADGKRLITWLKDWMHVPLEKVAFASSREEERARHVEEFRRGVLRLLVTTTILERGVTVPRCHVLVAGADHPVFDCSSLVQIAGRVGRSADYRKGEVWFVSRVVTGEMLRAKEVIRSWNRGTRQKGGVEEGR
ncbi:DEAD/DEAH box helicase [Desmospora profundinema]|uniref:Competence protein ComFA n=1 Tax=Desmospora profundinema TaxID=1571184 RepID=A0ABU1IP78_9BACL|nr:DEAD/DEAH box helicase [Desmospora profundinema]MDR6225565.1 competence protein ComFA [Desmospora profundinema]